MEGNQVVLILLKLLSNIAEKISKLMVKAMVGYLNHKQKLRDLNFKKGKVIKTDKLELKIAKNLKKTLDVKEKNIEKNITTSKFKLDCYKLEMQSELAELDKKIKILSQSLEFEKDPAKKEKFKSELYKTLNNRTAFEQNVNKNLLKKNNEINTLESAYKLVQQDIKVCSKAIDGFASDKAHHITESIRHDFDSIVERETLSKLEPNKDLEIEKQRKIKENIALKEREEVKKQNKLLSKEIDVIESIVTSEIIENINTNLVENINKDSIKNDKEIKKEVNKEVNKDIKDDEFMKEFMEKHRRKSLANDKNIDIER